ncbi:hypothetical protein BKE38_26555 [Pseudoroseomonas deserti]|uniref:Uncharacterized protein n=1 Tax=Teichococcus deserti TaxID=1817963 RepID=A0A1V2GUI3_9PROT|nr:hypothetical protein [Pseudoroseomonas deserti]ONG45379.1 hypothetical protein BKE38_26555 [Pseudoroseomonas deserti]
MDQARIAATPDAGAEGTPPQPLHPAEMKARVALTLGGGRSFVATARTTPAGLVAAGVLVSSILLSVALLVRVAKPGGR